MLAKNKTYKAFVARPTHVLNLDGELLDSAPIMVELTSEIRGISAYATYVVRNDTMLEAELGQGWYYSACGGWSSGWCYYA